MTSIYYFQYRQLHGQDHPSVQEQYSPMEEWGWLKETFGHWLSLKSQTFHPNRDHFL